MSHYVRVPGEFVEQSRREPRIFINTEAIFSLKVLKRKEVIYVVITLIIISLFTAYFYFIPSQKSPNLPEFTVRTENAYSNYSGNFTNISSLNPFRIAPVNGTTSMQMSGGFNSSLRVGVQRGDLFYDNGDNVTFVFLSIIINASIRGGLMPSSLTFTMNTTGSPGDGQVLLFMWYGSQNRTNLSANLDLFQISGYGSTSKTMSIENYTDSAHLFNFSYSVNVSVEFVPVPNSQHNILMWASLAGLGQPVQSMIKLSLNEM